MNPGLVDEYMLPVGKALYLATAFERKCQFVLRIAMLEQHIEDGGAATVFDYATTLRDALLGSTIRTLGTLPRVRADDLNLLDFARKARNFIAHEAADVGPVSSLTEGRVRQLLKKLREEVEHLTRGDNVVSRWVFEIEEKERAPLHMQQVYPELVSAWVFADLPE